MSSCEPSGPTSFARAGASAAAMPRAKRTRSVGFSGGRTVRSRRLLDMELAYRYSKNPKAATAWRSPAPGSPAYDAAAKRQDRRRRVVVVVHLRDVLSGRRADDSAGALD